MCYTLPHTSNSDNIWQSQLCAIIRSTTSATHQSQIHSSICFRVMTCTQTLHGDENLRQALKTAVADHCGGSSDDSTSTSRPAKTPDLWLLLQLTLLIAYHQTKWKEVNEGRTSMDLEWTVTKMRCEQWVKKRMCVQCESDNSSNIHFYEMKSGTYRSDFVDCGQRSARTSKFSSWIQPPSARHVQDE